MDIRGEICAVGGTEAGEERCIQKKGREMKTESKRHGENEKANGGKYWHGLVRNPAGQQQGSERGARGE